MSVIAAYMVPHPPMIVPEVGRGSERQVEATRAAYMLVAEDIAAMEPETVIISSPHATMYADYFHISPGREAEGSFAQFRAAQVRFREAYDTELVETVTNRAIETGRTLLEEVVGSVVHSIAYAVLYLLSFLALFLVLKLLLKPLDLASRLPGLRTLNGLGGAALGLVEATLLLYVAVWVLRKFQLVITPQLIEESMLLRIFTDYSPISLITSL